MIVTFKRHLVYKSHKNIYIYVVTKNYGSCKILIARYYIKCEALTLYTFLGNETKSKTIFVIVKSQTCQVT